MLKEFSIYSPAWYVEIRQADGQLVARRVDAIHGTVLTNETLKQRIRKRSVQQPITQQHKQCSNNRRDIVCKN